MTPPALARRSGIGGRLEAGHIVALDDPLAARRFTDDEIEYWRDWGLFYFVPCVSKEGTIAVLALGRKDSAEPLSSEDMALLAAVAGQVATALENGRLYRQLHVKADELDRLREFNENVLESLDDGLVVSISTDRIVRWNRALETALRRAARGRHRAAAGRRVRRALRRGRHGGAPRATRGRDALSRAAASRTDRRTIACSSTSPSVPLRQHRGDEVDATGTILIIEDISARVQLEEQLQVSEKMASIGLLAAGVAHEVNTPLTGIASFTQMLLEGADPEDPKTRLLEKIERQTFRAAKIVNGLLNLSRQGAANRRAIAPGRHQRRHQRRARPARAPARDRQGQGPPRARRRRRSSTGVGAQAAAGVPEPVPERARRHAASGGWLSVTTRIEDDQRAHRGRPTPGRASRASTSRASTIRSSRPSPSGRAPASACRSPTASSASTTARCGRKRASVRARAFTVRAARARYSLAQPRSQLTMPDETTLQARRMSHVADAPQQAPSSSSTTKRSCARSSRRC